MGVEGIVDYGATRNRGLLALNRVQDVPRGTRGSEIEKGASMHRFLVWVLSGLVCILAVSKEALAGGPDPASYPLRVHIMKFTTQPRDSRERKSLSDAPDYLNGMGVADLFENGEPRGFEFSYSCIGGLKASGGYGTFPARWKKKDKTLEVLLPETGKPWNLESCGLQTEMRTGLVFYWKNGLLAEEAAAVLKNWMVNHQYDPEKDKNEPVMLAGESDGDRGTGWGDSQIAEPE